MSPDLKECADKALKLPAHERAVLADRLIASLDELEEAEYEQVWLAEAERRYEAYRRGEISAKPVDEAIREARNRIR